MTYNEFTIQRLREVDAPILCAVSDVSEQEAIESTTIAIIHHYDESTQDFIDTYDMWWTYAVPVNVSPIPLPKSI